MSDILFHRLRVTDVVTETADACSLVFDLEPDQRERFTYRPGQFVTVRVPHPDGSLARCYSLASSPHVDDALKVTVKRVADGGGSNWLCDHALPGVELDVLEPAGRFTPASLDAHLLLFAAGSGISPVMSILKSALAAGTGRISLCYANRDEHSVIFKDELNALCAAQPGRLRVVHWLESVQGLPTVATLRGLAEGTPADESFICGPAPFMTAARTAARDIGVPARVERFTSLDGDPFTRARPATAPVESGPSTRVEVELGGDLRSFDWPPETRLLDVLTAHGLDVPASCGEGVCAACECRVVAGEVRMAGNHVLTEEDLADGYVLACQALPVSDLVRIAYG